MSKRPTLRGSICRELREAVHDVLADGEVGGIPVAASH